MPVRSPGQATISTQGRQRWQPGRPERGPDTAGQRPQHAHGHGHEERADRHGGDHRSGTPQDQASAHVCEQEADCQSRPAAGQPEQGGLDHEQDQHLAAQRADDA